MHGGLGNVVMHVWHVHECVMPAGTLPVHACSAQAERLQHTALKLLHPTPTASSENNTQHPWHIINPLLKMRSPQDLHDIRNTFRYVSLFWWARGSSMR